MSSTSRPKPAHRRVTANLALTLDGRYNGPGGAADLGSIVPYAVSDVARRHLGRIHENASTAVLGRLNAQGFLGYWPAVANDEGADPRDRAYARWLVEAQKVVFSSTLTTSPWERTRIVSAPAPQILNDLKREGTGEILINSSASIIKPLLKADLIDRLYLLITPEIAGDGMRLFDDGLPGTKWSLAHHEAGDLGEIALIYDRLR